ncbi:MAG: hypothetical protein AVDCRST_MAG77-334, partial [uncultured Chloroflexi bacterium]
ATLPLLPPAPLQARRARRRRPPALRLPPLPARRHRALHFGQAL